MFNNLFGAVHGFSVFMMTLFLVDEILQLKCVNKSIIFRGFLFNVEMASILFKTNILTLL